jgi:hypothetical protein
MTQAQSKLMAHHPQSDIVRVLSVAHDGLWVTACEGPSSPWQVRCALPAGTRVERGDELVVLHTAQGRVAIARVAGGDELSQELSDGTRVRIDGEKTRIQVERADGTPLFQYSASEGQGTITMGHEAMSVIATGGDLNLRAAGAIRMQGHTVSARAKAGPNSSTFELSPRRASVSGEAVQLKGEAFELEATRSEIRGDELHGQHRRAVLHVEHLESTMDVVVSTARNVYQSVHDLLQQQVGSLRTLVAGTARLQARDVAHRAEQAYKVRAEKIHLG